MPVLLLSGFLTTQILRQERDHLKYERALFESQETEQSCPYAIKYGDLILTGETSVQWLIRRPIL